MNIVYNSLQIHQLFVLENFMIITMNILTPNTENANDPNDPNTNSSS